MTPQEVQHPILALLQGRGPLTTEEIAKALGVTTKTAKLNLAPLQATGEVQLVGERWTLAHLMEPQELQPQELQPQELQPKLHPCAGGVVEGKVHPYTTRIHELLAHLADGPAKLPACPSRDALQQSQAIFPVHGGRWDLRSRVQPPRPKSAAPPIKATPPPAPAPTPHPLAIYAPPPPAPPPPQAPQAPDPRPCRAKLPDPATVCGALLHTLVAWGCFSPSTALPAAHIGRGFDRHTDCSTSLKVLARRGLVKKLGSGHNAVTWYAAESARGYVSHEQICSREEAARLPSVRDRALAALKELGATTMRRAVLAPSLAKKAQIDPQGASHALSQLWKDGVLDRVGERRRWRYWLKEA